MKGGFTDKDIKRLQEAALRARLEAYQRGVREDRKRWQPFDEPITFESLLNRLTKDDLTAIRMNLQLLGVSSLKKQQLISVLQQGLPAKLPRILNGFDENRYKILKQMSKWKGRTYFSIDNVELDYFKKCGLIFTGTLDEEKVLITPQEVLDVFRAVDGPAYRERVRKNTELIQLAQGLVYSYGTIRFSEFYALLFLYLEASEEYRMQTGDLLADAAEYYRTFRVGSNITDSRLLDIRKLWEEQEARADLPYYPFTKEQLLHAADLDYVERTPSFQAFVKYLLKHYDLDREEAEEYGAICVEKTMIGVSFHTQIEFLQQHFEFPDLQSVNSLAAHLVDLINNSRQWAIKGYTPMELRQLKKASQPSTDQASSTKGVVLDFMTRQKVGRNDPCPCGSGKKYKKCCDNA